MKKMIKKSIKNLISKYEHYRHYKSHRDKAYQILKDVESGKGKTDPKSIKLSNDYAANVLGWSGYAPWLYVYSAIAGCFKEGWIPDNYYSRVVIPATNYGKISALNSFTSKIFRSTLFPELVYYVNGLFYLPNYKIISIEEVKKIIFKNSDKVVFKLDNSSKGRGVFILEKSNFDNSRLQTLGNGVFQTYIKQHQLFKELMPWSVATIRMTTVMEKSGNSTLRACYLRIGRNDDTHIKAESSLRVPVDCLTGELSEKGFLSNWTTVNKHPDTNIPFINKVIPNFSNSVTAILELHKLFPLVHCIGWDVTIDENNILNIMEWNGGHNGIKF